MGKSIFSFVQFNVFFSYLGLHFSSSNCWTIAEVSDGSVTKKRLVVLLGKIGKSHLVIEVVVISVGDI